MHKWFQKETARRCGHTLKCIPARHSRKQDVWLPQLMFALLMLDPSITDGHHITLAHYLPNIKLVYEPAEQTSQFE